MLFVDEQCIRQDYAKILKMTILLVYVLLKEVLILIYKYKSYNQSILWLNLFHTALFLSLSGSVGTTFFSSTVPASLLSSG